MELQGTACVVTGAARGLGKAIARALLAHGARVAVVDVSAEELQETAAEFRRADRTVLPVVADVTVPEQVERMARQATDRLGPLEVLVNNAGTFSYIGPVWEADPEKWFRDIRVNLYGSFLVCRAVVGRMVQRRRGYVVNVVSSGGVGDPHPYSTSYASSKAGLMRLTEGLAKEVEPHGVKVFAVAPPAVLTEMTRFIMNDPGGKKWRPGFGRALLAGRGCPPEKVAALVLKLLSGRADALSGRYVRVQDEFESLVERTEEIIAGDLLTLRIRG